MQVEMGNLDPTKWTPEDGAPIVTRTSVPDTYTYKVAEDGARMLIGVDNEVEVTTAGELAEQAHSHIANALMFRDGIYHMPDQEALLAVMASWQAEGRGAPTWVWSDNEDFAKLLGAFFGCSVGRPADLEATHWTHNGPPGVGVGADALAEAAAAVSVTDEPRED